MLIENGLYFALGFLASALFALMVMPSVWHRAVRLTKKRIEAATPMTMAEFRADKDQLRAEFALTTRRLEKNVELLRSRLANEIAERDRARIEIAALKSERDRHQDVIDEKEAYEADLNRRVLDLERQSAELAQRLRQRDMEIAEARGELDALHGVETSYAEHNSEIADLIAALNAERTRNALLEQQAHALVTHIEQSGGREIASAPAFASMRRALEQNEDRSEEARKARHDAEARIDNAKSRLNALLEETQARLQSDEARSERSLAHELSAHEALERLRKKIAEIEDDAVKEWEDGTLDNSGLRERLNEIAADVTRLVFAGDDDVPDAGESLFERVQRFASNGLDVEEMPLRPTEKAQGALASRMEALRDAQAR